METASFLALGSFMEAFMALTILSVDLGENASFLSLFENLFF